MSKMDRQLNSKKDKDMIYEIYKACRLCGAGAGYKMPIIQNVIDLDDTDVELRQKVRDCVQIEVHQDDKMPPLICELCVDKVNDFYEFLEMCRQTNKRTRLKLGLPPQSMPRGAPDAGDCILGLAEPVYVNEDSDGEPLSKQKKTPPAKVKREPELKVKLEKRVLTESRGRFKRAPTPPRVTRHSTGSREDNTSISRLKEKSKSSNVTPKSILKKETRSSKSEDNSPLSPRLKRSREKEPIVKLETPVKKVKIAPKPSSPHTPKSSPKSPPSLRAAPAPRAPARAPAPPPSPPRVYKCAVCGQANKSPQANSNHLRAHVVTFTSEKLACDACGLWFCSLDEANAHHRAHRNKSRPYTCRHCSAKFRHRQEYAEHIANNECLPFDEVPDVKCDVCWHLFATNKLLEDHRCLGEDHRPGGKCGKCNRSYALLKNLKKHELTCTAKKKGEILSALLSQCSPVQVRVSRCDALLNNTQREHYDVSHVTPDFGLDKNCVYPYISMSSLRIKSDPESLDRMVAINQEIEEEFFAEDYVHWDSEEESDEETFSSVLNPAAKKRTVDSLANLTLKTLFSKKCLGKVPKKRRRVKQEKSMFDSLLEADDDVTKDINNIIDNLDNDDDNDSQKQENGEIEGDNNVSVDNTDKLDVSNDIDSNIVDENTEKNNSVQENDVVDNESAQSDVKISEKDDLSDQVPKQDDNDANSNSNSEKNDKTGSNYNINSNNDERTDGEVNDGTINNVSHNDDLSKKVSDNVTTEGKENQNDGVANNDVSENDAIKTTDSNSVSDVLNDSTQADVVNQTEKEVIDKININTMNDNTTPLPDPSDVDEKSENNELSQNETRSGDNQVTDIQTELSQGEENEYKNAISVIVNNSAKKSAEEMDDSKLMEALNAEIGESNDHSRSQGIDKNALDDLISGKNQGMDGIPEEFNFDA